MTGSTSNFSDHENLKLTKRSIKELMKYFMMQIFIRTIKRSVMVSWLRFDGSSIAITKKGFELWTLSILNSYALGLYPKPSYSYWNSWLLKSRAHYHCSLWKDVYSIRNKNGINHSTLLNYNVCVSKNAYRFLICFARKICCTFNGSCGLHLRHRVTLEPLSIMASEYEHFMSIF